MLTWDCIRSMSRIHSQQERFPPSTRPIKKPPLLPTPLSRPSAGCNEDETAAGRLRVTPVAGELSAGALFYQRTGQGSGLNTYAGLMHIYRHSFCINILSKTHSAFKLYTLGCFKTQHIACVMLFNTLLFYHVLY